MITLKNQAWRCLKHLVFCEIANAENKHETCALKIVFIVCTAISCESKIEWRRERARGRYIQQTTYNRILSLSLGWYMLLDLWMRIFKYLLSFELWNEKNKWTIIEITELLCTATIILFTHWNWMFFFNPCL